MTTIYIRDILPKVLNQLPDGDRLAYHRNGFDWQFLNPECHDGFADASVFDRMRMYLAALAGLPRTSSVPFEMGRDYGPGLNERGQRVFDYLLERAERDKRGDIFGHLLRRQAAA